MLMPAQVFKEELEKEFAKVMYNDDYYWYCGYPHCHGIPEIKPDDFQYQWVMVSQIKNEDTYLYKVVGWLAYRIDSVTNSVHNFGLYSFDKGNPIVGKDLFTEMERLVNKYHRIEWRVIDGNPVIRHYDKFCKKHNGNKVTLHDITKDPDGNYCDEHIYEIVNKENFK